ncbi:orotidine-5'-phosphate decarboxylase [Thiomicrospira sp. ALE5]|uniref:orotidine-5'-phosphate decarboxylase n=1 Tax=Thiomicrospira sp. ALE5 TaxID=748650 RepID=UPI0008ED95AA|nr:orotidine-5'-phosphate decarboxylase [Thiomicrospira sp. ALE5]SFR49856.1 orotidine-5'-phosphate decarboxylase [Thiomicrospira sp. ALE5]
MAKTPFSPVIVALDFPTVALALAFVDRLDPSECRLKVGKELFALGGPDLVVALQTRGFDVFVDLKYHDIPTTVAKACRVLSDLGVWMLNVHSLGGPKMIQAARDAIEQSGHPTWLIAVTILTSFDQQQLNAIGLKGSVAENVKRLAGLAASSGAQGVVCSALEAEMLRASFDQDFQLVTPGIRLANARADDQHRIMTPENAIRAGSSYLVIGRPITQADDPLAVLSQINQTILN